MTTYIFRWDRHGRKGQRCVILARGTMNSCLVRFEDGYMMVTSRNALGIKVPFNPTVATETVSAALAFAKCGISAGAPLCGTTLFAAHSGSSQLWYGPSRLDHRCRMPDSGREQRDERPLDNYYRP